MFLNVSLKSKGRLYIWIFCITVVIFILAILLIINKIDSIKNGTKFKEKVNLDFNEYYTQYDMTVISNKNINTYSVKEWHKEGVFTKLEYLDYMKNLVIITLKDNNCNIENSGNTAKLVINNMMDNKNIASLSTFVYLYNLYCGNNCCTKEKFIKDNEITIKINFKKGCSCDCNKISEELGISALELILLDGKPKNYTVYDENKKEHISIVYNVFKKDI